MYSAHSQHRPRLERTGAPLADADDATFYTPGPEGYIDYPTLG